MTALDEMTPFGFTWRQAIAAIRGDAFARRFVGDAESNRDTEEPCGGCFGRAAGISRDLRARIAGAAPTYAGPMRDVVLDLCPRHAGKLYRLRERRRQEAETERRRQEEVAHEERERERRQARLRDRSAANRESVVYRLRGPGGELLYVGVAYADGVLSRLGTHEKTKEWWPEVDAVAGISWTAPYATRFEAEEAEKAAIQTEAPRYNIVHALRPLEVVQRVANPVPAQDRDGLAEALDPLAETDSDELPVDRLGPSLVGGGVHDVRGLGDGDDLRERAAQGLDSLLDCGDPGGDVVHGPEAYRS